MSYNKRACVNCDDENEAQRKTNKVSKYATFCTEDDSESVKKSGYSVQLISVGIRGDNIYEARMILAPEVDMSSVKITVKDNNLRVTVRKPLDEFLKQLQETADQNEFNYPMKRTVKHCENFRIPKSINDEKVRAVLDNKERLLIVTAPVFKFTSNAIRKRLTDVERN